MLRRNTEALRCAVWTASITIMALVLTLPGNAVVLDQAYQGSFILQRHQS